MIAVYLYFASLMENKIFEAQNFVQLNIGEESNYHYIYSFFYFFQEQDNAKGLCFFLPIGALLSPPHGDDLQGS